MGSPFALLPHRDNPRYFDNISWVVFAAPKYRQHCRPQATRPDLYKCHVHVLFVVVLVGPMTPRACTVEHLWKQDLFQILLPKAPSRAAQLRQPFPHRKQWLIKDSIFSRQVIVNLLQQAQWHLTKTVRVMMRVTAAAACRGWQQNYPQQHQNTLRNAMKTVYSTPIQTASVPQAPPPFWRCSLRPAPPRRLQQARQHRLRAPPHC